MIPGGRGAPDRRAFVANCDDEQRRRRELAARLCDALQGVSCAKIAERTGWSTESIRRYLQGKASPPATLLMVLAERFGLNPEFLLLGRGPAHLEGADARPRPVSTREVLDALYFLVAEHEAARNAGERPEECGAEGCRAHQGLPELPFV